MSEITLNSRPVLGDVALGLFGANTDMPGVILTALPEGHVLHILAGPGKGDAETELGQATARFKSSLRKVSPGQWFAVGDNAVTPAEVRELGAAIATIAALSDQSHGRVRLRAEGSGVLPMLAKGIAADLDLSVFPVGHSGTMICGHVTVHVTRLAADSFELMSLRGFAPDLWDSLVHQALEFGLECRAA